MRNLCQLNEYRVKLGHYDEFEGDDHSGAFVIRSATSMVSLRIIAARGEGWEHVSVSTISRCPTWDEMEQVKRMFFQDDETVMQLHVPPAEHINCHPYTLHLWRPIKRRIPRPPSAFV